MLSRSRSGELWKIITYLIYYYLLYFLLFSMVFLLDVHCCGRFPVIRQIKKELGTKSAMQISRGNRGAFGKSARKNDEQRGTFQRWLVTPARRPFVFDTPQLWVYISPQHPAKSLSYYSVWCMRMLQWTCGKQWKTVYEIFSLGIQNGQT